LVLEYAPNPPFQSGSYLAADRTTVRAAKRILAAEAFDDLKIGGVLRHGRSLLRLAWGLTTVTAHRPYSDTVSIPVPDKSIQFDGREVRYGITGEGPPMVIVHGTPWSSFNLRHLIE